MYSAMPRGIFSEDKANIQKALEGTDSTQWWNAYTLALEWKQYAEKGGDMTKCLLSEIKELLHKTIEFLMEHNINPQIKAAYKIVNEE